MNAGGRPVNERTCVWTLLINAHASRPFYVQLLDSGSPWREPSLRFLSPSGVRQTEESCRPVRCVVWRAHRASQNLYLPTSPPTEAHLPTAVCPDGVGKTRSSLYMESKPKRI